MPLIKISRARIPGKDGLIFFIIISWQAKDKLCGMNGLSLLYPAELLPCVVNPGGLEYKKGRGARRLA